VVDSTEYYAVRLIVARQMQKASPGWKERSWGNSGCRVDGVSGLDLMGIENAMVEEHEFCLG